MSNITCGEKIGVMYNLKKDAQYLKISQNDLIFKRVSRHGKDKLKHLLPFKLI